MKNGMEVLDRGSFSVLLEEATKKVCHHIVAIAFGQRGEAPKAVATAFLVRMFDADFLVTARHVVRNAIAESEPWWILVNPRSDDGQMPDGVYQKAKAVSIPATALLWDSLALDTAILQAPENLGVDAFVVDDKNETFAKMTEKIREANSQDARFKVVVSGFPNFTRERTSAVFDLGLATIAANIEQYDDMSGKLTLEPGVEEIKAGLFKEKEELFRKQLGDDQGEVEPLAGFSGAPVVLVLQDEITLVGVISEGKRSFSRAYAFSWLKTYEAFKSLREIGLSVSNV